MPDETRTSPCPICGAAGGIRVASYHAADVAQALMPRRLDRDRHNAIRRKLAAMWRDESSRLWRCDGCDFIHVDPFVAGDAEFYGLAFPRSAYPARKWEFDRTRRVLGALCPDKLDVLEIGAGDGAFLKLLLSDGNSPANLRALEFSAFGRAAIARLGVECTGSDVRSAAFDRDFDVVCMFQVLEHLDDYDGMFATFDKIVRPGGRLFISTPNCAWIESNERRGLLRDMPPNHISRWSPTSIAALAHRFGWHLEQCELEPRSSFWSIGRTLTDRYVRQVSDEARWESWWARAAARTPNASLGRSMKLGAALTSPACLAATLRAAVAGSPPPSIWAHLRRPDVRARPAALAAA